MMNLLSKTRTAFILLLFLAFSPSVFAQWDAYGEGTQLVITYNGSQHAVLHTESGYFRMVYGPGSGWGTSVVVLPSYWSRNRLYQGARVDTNWYPSGANFVLHYYGWIGSLYTNGKIVIKPPRNNQIRADVSVSVQGSAALDSRPGEAFRPVFLSSMNVAPNQWDSIGAWNGRDYSGLPQEGLIFSNTTTANRLTLDGGSNSWKTNAPTVDVYFDRRLTSMGWVTRSSDPNDDNVGLWLGTNRVIDFYSYEIVTRKAE